MQVIDQKCEDKKTTFYKQQRKLKAKYEKEQKKLSQREWKIAIISAVLGGLVGLLPTIIPIIANLFCLKIIP